MSFQINYKANRIYKTFSEYFQGNYSIKGKRLPKALVIGLVGVTLMYVGVAGMISINAPWTVRGDTRQHVDYIWRFYNFELPKRTDGIQYPELVRLAGEFKPQAASKNPPLFYAIHAPFVGPLLAQDKLESAIAVGRLINIIIGILCIAVLAWAGWLFGGNRKALIALAVPALSILIFRHVRLNVDFALDGLLILLGTLSLIFSYKIIKDGTTKWLLGAITAISVAGMFTKISFIVLLFTNLFAVFLSVLIHSKDKPPYKLLKAGLIASAILLIVIVLTGWYYYFHDYKVSGGNWFNAAPADRVINGREVKTFRDVVTSLKFWGLFHSNFARNSTFSILITGFALSGILNTKGLLKKISMDRITIATTAVISLSFIGVLLTQLDHAVGQGSINFRYMLPVILIFGLFLAYGLLQPRWTKGLLAAFVAIMMGATSIGAYAPKTAPYFHNVLDKFFSGFFTATSANKIPAVIPVLLLLFFALGSIIFTVSIFKLASSSRKEA